MKLYVHEFGFRKSEAPERVANGGGRGDQSADQEGGEGTYWYCPLSNWKKKQGRDEKNEKENEDLSVEKIFHYNSVGINDCNQPNKQNIC
jgi:hypothetical protein